MKVYNFVVDLLGNVPIEFEWLTALGVIVVFVAIIWCAIYPIKFLYDLVFRKW